MRSLGAIIAAVGLSSGCVAPCRAASVLSAYEAESGACVRLSATRIEAEACLLEVQERYNQELIEVGEETKDVIRYLTE